jgi:hypothetical protein
VSGAGQIYTNSFETRESTAFHNQRRYDNNMSDEEDEEDSRINSMTRLEHQLKRDPLDVL